MSVDREALLSATILSFFNVYPHIAGMIHYLSFTGLQAFEVPGCSNPWANFIGAARLHPDNADQVIQEVYQYFASQTRSFGWMLDSASTPSDLAMRLEKAGLRKVGSYAGMALTNLNISIRTNTAIQIRKAQPADLPDIVALMDEAFASGEDNRDLYEYSLTQADQFFFMAHVEGVERAVALGRMFYYPDSAIAVMQDAVTTVAYRGQGIYSTLMAKRLEVARDDGKLAAVMQADRETSAPICARMGFQEISNLDFYVWRSS